MKLNEGGIHPSVVTTNRKGWANTTREFTRYLAVRTPGAFDRPRGLSYTEQWHREPGMEHGAARLGPFANLGWKPAESLPPKAPDPATFP